MTKQVTTDEFLKKFETFLKAEDYIISSLKFKKGEWFCSIRKNGSHKYSYHGFGSSIAISMCNVMRKARGEETWDGI